MLQTDWISNFYRLLFTHIDEKCFQEKKAHLGKKKKMSEEMKFCTVNKFHEVIHSEMEIQFFNICIPTIKITTEF